MWSYWNLQTTSNLLPLYLEVLNVILMWLHALCMHVITNSLMISMYHAFTKKTVIIHGHGGKSHISAGTVTDTALMLTTSSTRGFVPMWEKITSHLFILLNDQFFWLIDLLCPLHHKCLSPHAESAAATATARFANIKSKTSQAEKKYSSHFLPCFSTIVHTKNITFLTCFFNWILVHWPCMVDMSAPWLN